MYAMEKYPSKGKEEEKLLMRIKGGILMDSINVDPKIQGMLRAIVSMNIFECGDEDEIL